MELQSQKVVQTIVCNQTIQSLGNIISMKKILFSLFIGLILFISPSRAFANANEDSVSKAISYLRTQQSSNGKFIGFDTSSSQFDGISSWVAIAFESTNADIDKVQLVDGKSLLAYIQLNSPTATDSATDWEKRILAIVGAGKDPHNFGSIDYVDALEKNYYNINDSHQIGSNTLINDDVFGLLALLGSKESTSSAIVNDALKFILEHQNTDGGFSSSTTGGSDIDDSAAAIMAMADAQKQGMLVGDAINSAKAYILKTQNSDGGFYSNIEYGTDSNIDSTAWVIMALNSIGDIAVENSNAQMYVRCTQQSDNSFPYEAIYPPGDAFDTAYAVMSLTGKYWPLSSDVVFTTVEPTVNCASSSVSPTSIPTDAFPSPSPTPTSTSSSNSSSNQTITPTPTPSIIPTTTPTQTLLAENQLVPIQSGPTQAVLGSSITTDVLSPTPALSAKVSPTSLNWSFLSKFLIGLGVILFLTCGILVLKRYKQLN